MRVTESRSRCHLIIIKSTIITVTTSSRRSHRDNKQPLITPAAATESHTLKRATDQLPAVAVPQVTPSSSHIIHAVRLSVASPDPISSIPLVTGCVYMGRRYAHAEEVITSQACLNCTCQHGFVSCFRRVCPVLDPPENDDTCYLLKEPGTCCAVLKCSGLASSPPPKTSSSSTMVTTSRPQSSTSAYHFNPGKNSFFGGNSIERKAVDTFRRQTSRPPYKDYWTSSRPTSRQQPQSRPFLRATSRPVSYASVARITTTLRPLNRHGFPSAPTFAQRRPNYPLSVNSKPTMRRTMYKTTTGRTTTASSRKNPSTMTSSSPSHQANPGLQSPLLDEDASSEESSNFFRMSSILV